jgi:hypothetical protein
VGGEVFTVEVHTEAAPAGAETSHVAVVALRSSSSGSKVIGKIPIGLDAGLPSVPYPRGVWASPHERRIAVVLLAVTWRLHGPPLGGTWRILGAHLDEGFPAK